MVENQHTQRTQQRREVEPIGGTRLTDSQPLVLSQSPLLRDEFCTQLAHRACS